MNDTAQRPMTVLDTHVHFWDVDELDYPWLAAEPTLNRTWVPSDLLAESHIRGDHTVRGVIFVQADCAWPDAMREVDWVRTR